MLNTQEHGQSIIEVIYEAALDTDRWDEVMSALAQVVDAHVCYLSSFIPRERRLLFTRQLGFDSDHARSGARHIENPWTGNGFPPVGHVIRMDDICPLDVLRRSEFYQDFLGPCNADHTMSGMLLAESDVMTTFSISRSERKGPFDDKAMTTLKRFIPHLSRATQIAFRLAENERQRVSLSRALDCLRAAVFLIDSRGKVCSVNRSAEELASEGTVLTIVRGVLTTKDPTRCIELKRTIEAALQAASGFGPQSGGCLTLEDSEGNPLDVVVAPLGRESASGLIGSPSAVVIVGGVNVEAPSNEDLLRKLYSLTAAETKLAIALVEQDGLAAAAEVLEIQIGTARTHLKRIFEKTGCHRQSDLVRRFLRGPLALR
jgi:DNA-binding CsgD family transcriptional regulator/PAS domain-containing protein